MSHLLLTDDEVALLRWTCELFFVPESPVYFIDAEAREPRDFAQTYSDLIKKGVLDESSFRLTDAALNRLAPLTECDARVVLLLPSERGGRQRTRDYYLLDEIGVEYEDADNVHATGGDQDHGELVASLAKRFMPRRAAGDYLNVHMSTSEFMVFSVLCHKARKGGAGVAEQALLAEVRPALLEGRTENLSGSRRRNREGATSDGGALRHRAAALVATGAQDPSPALDITARSTQPVAEPTQVMRARSPAGTRLAALQGADDESTAVDPPRNRRSGGQPDVAEQALKGLIDKGVVLCGARGVELRPALQSFALGVSERSRHTFVRFDFSDDEWFIRETSFLAAEGTLFCLYPDEHGGLGLTELDGRRLETWLGKAVGPLPELSPEESPGKSAKDFLLRA